MLSYFRENMMGLQMLSAFCQEIKGKSAQTTMHEHLQVNYVNMLTKNLRKTCDLSTKDPTFSFDPVSNWLRSTSACSCLKRRFVCIFYLKMSAHRRLSTFLFLGIGVRSLLH